MIALAIVAAMAAALPAKLPPIDQCSDDDGFSTFRETLASASASEDVDALSRLIAPELLNDQFGPTADGYWPQLRVLLRMGCVRDGAARIMPSTPRQLEAFEPGSAKGRFLVLPGANLIDNVEDPNSLVDGPVMKWDVVEAAVIAGHIWTGVVTADGRRGWIDDSELYSLEWPSRIIVEQRDGQWLITSIE